MKRILLASAAALAVAGLIGPAAAADLSRQAGYRGPSYLPMVYNWQGLYVGVNGGGVWGSSNWTGAGATMNVTGGMVGGTAGYNWQFGQWILGLEGDLDWASMTGTAVNPICPATGCSTQSGFLGTARGRIGYAFDRVMPYITGGLAVGNIQAGSISTTNAGWTVGAGVEFAIAPQFTAKFEYLYVDLGQANCGLGTACNFIGGTQVGLTENVFRAGVNFRL